MLNFAAGSEIEEIEARIQDRVGEFLSAKKRILDLTYSPNPDIAREAAGLLAMQKDLEGKLPGALETIEKVKKDVHSISDILEVGSFAVLIERHLRAVDDLERKSRGEAPSILAQISSPNRLLWIVAGLGALFFLWKGRK